MMAPAARFLFFVCVLVSLASCAAIPTQEQIATADYGSYPDDYKAIIKSYLAASLFDPYSAVYSDWTEPVQGYAGDRLTGFAHGYSICVTVNAKNRFGAYVGARLYHFVLRNGAVVKSTGGDEPGSLGAMMAERFCRGAHG